MDIEFLVRIASVAGVVVALFVAVFELYKYVKSRGRLSISANLGREVSNDGIGTYLAALVTISNSGGAPIYFGGVQALDETGEVYYPLVTIAPQIKLEPTQPIQGAIPAAHLLKGGARKLWAVDGNGKKYQMGNKAFAELMKNLKSESKRLEALGLRLERSGR